MNPAYHKFVQDTSYNVRRLMDLYSYLAQANVLWAGVPNYDTLITQTEINSDPNFQAAGLTAQNLADAQFALSNIRQQIESALPALTILANLP